MKNVHRNIRDASLISLFLLLCIVDTWLDILSYRSRYRLCDCCIICFLLAAIIFAIMYRSIRWKRTKNIQAYLKSDEIGPDPEAQVRLFLETAPEYYGMQYSPLFIPVFKLNYLTLYMYDSKSNVSLSFWSENEVDLVIQLLKHEYPFLIEYKATK